MTRNGKIARLPQDIREELNERILNGQSADQLMAWLHEQEEVWAVLDAHGFDAITDQNISEWKAGGYQAWQENQEAKELVVEIALKSRDLGEETLEENMGQCVGNLLMVEFIKMMKVLVQKEEDPEKRWSQLERVNRELARLRGSNAKDTWAGIQQKRCDWAEEDREEAQEEKHAAWVKQQRLALYQLLPVVAIKASGHKKEDYDLAWCVAAREVEIKHDLPEGLLDRQHEGGFWYWDEEEERWFWRRQAERAKQPTANEGEGEKRRQGQAKGNEEGGSEREEGGVAKAPTSKHQAPEKRPAPNTKAVVGQEVDDGIAASEPSAKEDGFEDGQAAGENGPISTDSNQFKPVGVGRVTPCAPCPVAGQDPALTK